MSKPIQQHYLPKSAYLRFFEHPQRPGFIYFYRRGKAPTLANIGRIAKERYLYSFIDEKGSYDHTLEEELAKLELATTPILRKLNQASRETFIAASEKHILSEFIAVQFVRTPGFRNQTQDVFAEMARVLLLRTAQDMKVLKSLVEELDKNEGQSTGEEPDLHKLREFILKGEYGLKFTGNLLPALVGDFAADIAPALMIKEITIIRAPESEAFVTSDYPASVAGDSKMPPFYRSGFLMGRVVLPIGSHSFLQLENKPDHQLLESPDQKVEVSVKQVDAENVDLINRYIIANAENYVFSSEEDSKVQRMLDDAEIPRRFHIYSPFENEPE